MKQKGIGDRSMPVVGFGCAVGGYPDGPEVYDGLEDMVRAAMDMGVVLFDTAPVYGDGESERALGRAIKGKREDVFIATKVGAADLMELDVQRSVDESRKRLGTDYIDLLQIHWPNSLVPLAETISIMSHLHELGVVENIGVCNFPFVPREVGAAFMQNEWNLCTQYGSAPDIAYAPLARGRMYANAYQRNVVENIATVYGVAPATIILSYLLNIASFVIPNTTNLDHLRDNVRAGRFDLELEHSEVITRTVPRPLEVNPNVIFAGATPPTEQLGGLMRELERWGILKPIQVIETADGYKMRRGGGVMRYWAWRELWPDKPIPVLVVE